MNMNYILPQYQYYLENLTGLEGSSRQQNNRTWHMSWLNAHHVRVLIVSEVTELLGTLHPRIPDNCVGEVVLLDAHLATGHHVCDDVLLWSILEDTVCPLIDGYHITAFLTYRIYSGLNTTKIMWIVINNRTWTILTSFQQITQTLQLQFEVWTTIKKCLDIFF